MHQCSYRITPPPPKQLEGEAASQRGLNKRDIAKRLILNITDPLAAYLAGALAPERELSAHGGAIPNPGAAKTIPSGKICRNLWVPEVDLPEKDSEGASSPL